MRILIVEDEKKVADFIKKGLRQEGYAADVARDGEEGAPGKRGRRGADVRSQDVRSPTTRTSLQHTLGMIRGIACLSTKTHSLRGDAACPML